MIAFCTTCKGRVQHIRETLPHNLANNPGDLSKFILVDYNSQDGLVEYLKAEHAESIRTGKLVVYHFPAASVFQMAHAKNMAHRLGIREGCDILCNLDGDNLTGAPGFDRHIAERFAGAHSFMWAKMFTMENGKRPRGISGRIAVTANSFLKLGGYDEKYAAWGHDDKDFNLRLSRTGHTGIEIDPCHLDAVLHTNKMRFKEYPHLINSSNQEKEHEVGENGSTVVNYGHFGCGTVFRNFDFDHPIELKDVPTRIFGIGMHKTGTTSLHSALNLLGLDSAHWQDAHWAKAIWEEMEAWGTSLTLERHYSLSDLPITLLYRKLDVGYPGSKFILTTRTEESWIRSVEKHWDHNSNPFRYAWSTDPFTHRVHKLLYGTKGFDGPLFLDRFRRHNAEVLEYFKNRPNDLLVMNMSNGAGWPELCSFLDKPVPDVPYPKKLVTR